MSSNRYVSGKEFTMDRINCILPRALMIMAVCALLLTGCSGEKPAVATLPSTSAATNDCSTEPTPIPDGTTLPSAPADTTVPADTTAPVETIVPTTVPVTTEPVVTEPPVVQEPADDAFVRVADYIPDVIIDLKYATEDNICGKVVYQNKDAYLRYGTVKKLAAVQKELKSMGYSLKIWDAYRALDAQADIWAAFPDQTYVTNPRRGYSNHCRGNNVDVTIVDSNGKELEMPTGFDAFSPLCDRDYSDCTAEAAKNSQLLEDIMLRHGFKAHFLEWWQYIDTTDYPIDTEFLCN